MNVLKTTVLSIFMSCVQSHVYRSKREEGKLNNGFRREKMDVPWGWEVFDSIVETSTSDMLSKIVSRGHHDGIITPYNYRKKYFNVRLYYFGSRYYHKVSSGSRKCSYDLDKVSHIRYDNRTTGRQVKELIFELIHIILKCTNSLICCDLDCCKIELAEWAVIMMVVGAALFIIFSMVLCCCVYCCCKPAGTKSPEKSPGMAVPDRNHETYLHEGKLHYPEAPTPTPRSHKYLSRPNQNYCNYERHIPRYPRPDTCQQQQQQRCLPPPQIIEPQTQLRPYPTDTTVTQPKITPNVKLGQPPQPNVAYHPQTIFTVQQEQSRPQLKEVR